MSAPIDPADFIAIHQLVALYGHIVDAQQWDRVDELFADDGVFDMSAMGIPAVCGPAAIARLWASQTHPTAHIATNMVVTVVGDGWAVLSKGFGYWPGGSVGSVIYRDIVQRRETGHRLVSRTASLSY